MGSDWREVNLGDLFAQSNQGVNTTTEKVEYSDDGLIVIRAKNISAYSIDYQDVVNVSEETFGKLKAAVKPKCGDILFTNIGSQLGSAALIKNNSKFIIAWNVFRIVPNLCKVNAKFLESFLNSEETGNLVRGLNASSTMPFISGKVLRSIKLNLPPLPEQKAIAHILGSLDDKIELNWQMNETLEAMAQALFKSWFVDFDPVIDNALAAGKPIPDELLERAEQRKAVQHRDTDNHAIRALFPDAFELTDEMGWIPEGWESITLGNFAILGNGKTSPDRAVGEIPVFGSNGKIGDCDESNRDNTIIIGRVGSYCGSLQYYPSKCWITDNAMSAEMKNKDHNIYLFQLLSRDNLNDRRTGSGQPLLNQSILRSIKTIMPSVLVIDEYSRIANSFYEKIDESNRNNESLAKLRDTLLPKLMSGELRLDDVEILDKV